MKRRILGLVIMTVALVALVSGNAEAQLLSPAQHGSMKAKKIYRGSSVIYENVFNARALDPGAQLSYNPYYAQSLTFLPQIWLRDDMFLRARLGVEVELTLSDSTDTKREPVLTDLYFDYTWLHALEIPGAKISVTPLFRLRLPTSKVSQGQSMMMALAPGVSLSRGFKLTSGKFFSNLTLIYTFRFSARLHEYQTAQVDSTTCSALGVAAQDRPECVTSGMPNSKFRFTNSFTARLTIHPKAILTLSLALIDDLKYELEATEYTGPSTHTHLAYVSSGIDVTVPVVDWLYLSIGATSFHNQLEDDSSLQMPFFNRFVNFYFDATIPIDKMIDQVKRWAS